MPMSARWRVVLLLTLLVGLLSPAPAAAASPTETMEGFFDRANAILRGADPAGEPRVAIRQLVNEMIEFREAAALALGAAWSSKPGRPRTSSSSSSLEFSSAALSRPS